MSKILVTGATGTTGQHVVEALLAQGADIRLGVRTPSKVAHFVERGAEAVVYDYDRPETLQVAMTGVDRVFLLTPFNEHSVALTKTAVQAAETAGVSFVLKLSAVGADPEAPGGPGKSHGLAENVIKASNLAWTMLQPTFFQDNILNFQGASIKGQGHIYGASGEGKASFVSAGDIGRAAATILLNPEPHHGQSYVLTGPEAFNNQQIASMVGEIVGKPVIAINLTPEQYGEGMRASGASEWMIENMLVLEGIKAKGWAEAISPAYTQITGQPAEHMLDYLSAKKARLVGEA